MDILAERIDPYVSFWLMNPQFKLAFSKLYSNDTTKDKSFSSLLMWTIVLAYHPRSIFSNLPLEEKLKLSEERCLPDILPQAKIKTFWKDYESEIDIFTRMCISREHRLLSYHQKDLDDRQAFLSSIPYSVDTPKDLLDLKEKWSKDTVNHWKGYRECLKDVLVNEEGTSRDGAVQSLTDTGEL